MKTDAVVAAFSELHQRSSCSYECTTTVQLYRTRY